MKRDLRCITTIYLLAITVTAVELDKSSVTFPYPTKMLPCFSFLMQIINLRFPDRQRRIGDDLLENKIWTHKFHSVFFANESCPCYTHMTHTYLHATMHWRLYGAGAALPHDLSERRQTHFLGSE